MATGAEPDVPKTLLSNGVRVPMVAFGTSFVSKEGVRSPEEVWTALPAALDAGCRHIDTSSMSGCERHVGTVIGQYMMAGKLKREDLFVCTKVGHPPTVDFHGAKTEYIYDPSISAFDGVLKEFYMSLGNLGLGYVDLLLVHWPGLFRAPQRFPPNWTVPAPSRAVAQKKRLEMWSALELIYSRKQARAIGVANFSREHLEHLLPACKVMPMINQLEVHPYCSQAEVVTFCQTHGIQIAAYAPLGAPSNKVLEDPKIVELARTKGVSPSDVVLSWLLQRDIVVVPPSSSSKRWAQNLHVSQGLLDGAEVAMMDGLDYGLHGSPDPNDIP
eukprot:CAMPEP_0176077832 /NCGR_PEP_ID=MMETSP0120_2-20121206/38920_1 /TAXON_ID=160619 /ORGANISM="Kryptoperidinium foliaceum, Strain CCMP 1326" /LENGTH=328 /DNA_ID=CAMNT_0017411573 /DNA_START=33 /DNA_END=1019 /DNA_ORIENTATION=-